LMTGDFIDPSMFRMENSGGIERPKGQVQFSATTQSNSNGISCRAFGAFVQLAKTEASPTRIQRPHLKDKSRVEMCPHEGERIRFTPNCCAKNCRRPVMEKRH
jgi:hypothetical protein